jgi:hypothetical protein
MMGEVLLPKGECMYISLVKLLLCSRKLCAYACGVIVIRHNLTCIQYV